MDSCKMDSMDSMNQVDCPSVDSMNSVNSVKIPDVYNYVPPSETDVTVVKIPDAYNYIPPPMYRSPLLPPLPEVAPRTRDNPGSIPPIRTCMISLSLLVGCIAFGTIMLAAYGREWSNAGA